MNPIVRFVGPTQALEVYGVKLVGINAANANKLLFTLGFYLAVVLLRHALRWVSGRLAKLVGGERAEFWSHEAIRLLTTIVLILGLVSIWFDDPTRLTTALGLVTAGLAFALQKVVTAVAGYFVILRGKTFNVGDRISMGGVRGDVIALGFIQTTIMEMGQPPAVQDADPAQWVRARQYSGRIVTVTNDKIFDTPVYNYTREFPYIWDEIHLPVAYAADRVKAEQILLDVAEKHSLPIAELSRESIEEMERRYFMKPSDMGPKVYYRLTDNWLELTVRFICEDHGIRDLKDAMSRDILTALDASGIGIASATYDVVGFPPITIRREPKTP